MVWEYQELEVDIPQIKNRKSLPLRHQDTKVSQSFLGNGILVISIPQIAS